MSGGFGKNLRVTLFGESSSDAVGFVMEGLPANTPVDLGYIRASLDRRASMRRRMNPERMRVYDSCRVLSGYRDGKAGGTPLAVMIENDGLEFAHQDGVMRPSTADYGAVAKYGDIEGSFGAAHLTPRLHTAVAAAGAIARQILRERYSVTLGAHIFNMGGARDKSFSRGDIAPSLIEELIESDFPVLSADARERMIAEARVARESGETLGGSVECAVIGLPPGIGDPLFGSVQGNICGILFGLCGVCAVEFGLGFDLCYLTGGKANDPFKMAGGRVKKASNNSGGVLGPMTDGDDIYFRVGFKPDPGVLLSQRTVNLKTGNEVTYTARNTGEDGDVCAAFSEICTIEGAVSLAVLDLLL